MAYRAQWTRGLSEVGPRALAAPRRATGSGAAQHLAAATHSVAPAVAALTKIAGSTELPAARPGAAWRRRGAVWALYNHGSRAITNIIT